MSTTSDPPATTTIQTTGVPRVFDRFSTVLWMTALVDGNILAASTTFFNLYGTEPQMALLALRMLARGNENERDIFSRLFSQLSLDDPHGAQGIIVAFWEQVVTEAHPVWCVFAIMTLT